MTEREEFELAVGKKMHLTRYAHNDDYDTPETYCAWFAWQAAKESDRSELEEKNAEIAKAHSEYERRIEHWITKSNDKDAEISELRTRLLGQTRFVPPEFQNELEAAKHRIAELEGALNKAIVIIDGAIYCGHQLNDNGEDKLLCIRQIAIKETESYHGY